MRRCNNNTIQISSNHPPYQELEAVNMGEDDDGVQDSCVDFSGNKLEPACAIDTDQDEPDLTTVEVELTIDDHSIDLGEESDHILNLSPRKDKVDQGAYSLAKALNVSISGQAVGFTQGAKQAAPATLSLNDHVNTMVSKRLEKLFSFGQSIDDCSLHIQHNVQTISNKDTCLPTHLKGFNVGKQDNLGCSRRRGTKCGPFPRSVRVRCREKVFKCEACGKCFNRNQNLQTHLRTHSGEKKYKCEVCSKCFSESNTLKRHLRIHSGEKDYKCDECGKCFAQVSSLKRHIKIHTCEKDYACEECGKCFSVLDYLKTHLKMHSGERDYKCEECGKGFAVGNALNRHLRIHSVEKAYICKECGKGFNQRFNLVNHLRIHSRIKDFKCEECGKCFAHGAYLKRHLRIHSGPNDYKRQNVTHVLDLVMNT